MGASSRAMALEGAPATIAPMGKRRACPVCRSREWHKEPSSGTITCSEGHVLQDYRKETFETTEMGPHAVRKRTMKSDRVARILDSKSDDILYYGARARYFYVEILQLLLRKQVAILIATWNLAPEFEVICRDIWALHLSLLPHPPPPEPFLHVQDQNAGKLTAPRSEDYKADEKQDDADDEKQDNDLPDDSENELSERDILLADLLREASQSESDRDEEDEGRSKIRPTVSLKEYRSRYGSPAGNIAVLALACWTMRVPVMYIDFIRLIEEYKLPYLEPVRYLPPEMARHLTKYTVSSVSPKFPPKVFTLHSLTSRLGRLCWTKYGIHTPEANAAPLLWRIVRSLCGTSTLYALTKSIADVLGLPLAIHPVLAPQVMQMKRTDPRHHRNDNIPPELALVAAVTVVLKLVYGLDGIPRRSINPADPAYGLPCLGDWLDRLRQSAGGAKEYLAAVSEIEGNELDGYLEFCERALLGNQVPDKTIAEFFPPSLAKTKVEREGPEGEADGIGGMRPSEPVTDADAVEPGSLVRVYNTLDTLGTLPAEYATVLETSARAVGVKVDDVARVTERFERRLMRWADRQRS